MMRITLSGSGYQVFDARSGEEALERFRAYLPDLVVLDLNMPEVDGLEVCRDLRLGSDVPVIVLTVRNEESEKVEALDAGADDYVTKPFGMRELLARIRAALRRAPTAPEAGPRSYSSNELQIDFEVRRVYIKGKTIRLTPKEFELLRYLISREGKPVPHRELLQAIWGPDYGEQGDYLRVFINHLRKKIEPNPAEPEYILTEPWFGYGFASRNNS